MYLQSELLFAETEAILLKILKEYPESALLMHHLGRLYYEDGKIEKARINIEKAVRLQANREETHLFLGHLYQKTDQFEKAVLSYERVLTLNDEYAEAYRSLIRIHQKSGKLDELCARWLQRYHHQKQNPVLREFLIDALHRANQFDEARALLQ
jgi:lipopolysaccharide biosynthesis regulator YciM